MISDTAVWHLLAEGLARFPKITYSNQPGSTKPSAPGKKTDLQLPEKSLHLVFGSKSLNGATKSILFLLENTPPRNSMHFNFQSAMLCQGNHDAAEWQVSAAERPQLPPSWVCFKRPSIVPSYMYTPPPPPHTVQPGLTQLPPRVSPTRLFLCFYFHSLPVPFPVAEAIHMVDW